MFEPAIVTTEAEVEEFPVFMFTDPPVFPFELFPPVFELEFILKLMLELLV